MFARGDIEQKPAKLRRLSVAMLAIDDVVNPDNLPRRCHHAVLKLKIFGAFAERRASIYRKFPVVWMKMGNPKIFFVPL
ncbi:MAG TPA: hypothetical protein VFQ03_07520, partial [Candidatus Binatia bacterium]|nr:hypothetical protein [Candidatus Binatia bacterium]